MKRFVFLLQLIIVLAALPALTQPITTQEEITYEKDTLEEFVKVSEERAKGIAKGFFNLNYYLESREAKRILENPAIQDVFRLYEDSTNVKVISTSYINLPANDFWTKGARNSVLKKFETLKNSNSTFLANEVKFGPDDTSYGVNVDMYPSSQLESKTGLTKAHIDEIALPIATELLYPVSYESPGEAAVELINYYIRLLGGLSSYKTSRMEMEEGQGFEYDYFVTDNDAWYREKEAPYKAITPEPRTDVLAHGLQVAVLEVVKDGKDKDVAKIKLKNTEDIEYTSLSNLSQVKGFSRERQYKLLVDYDAIQLPFSTTIANKTYKTNSEVTIVKYCGEYLKVKGEGGDVEGHWIAKDALIWVDLLSKVEFLAQTKDATKIGTRFKENTTDPACNICVRSALLLLKEDPALFPEGGSAFFDPQNDFTESYPKGYITNPGRAKNIKLDMDVISTKLKLNERFTEVEKQNTESWEDYFKRLQDKADLGGIVVGVMLNSSGTQGHVMMISPGGLVDIDAKEEKDVVQKWGKSFTLREILKVPRVLECGNDARENEAPLCRNVDYSGAVLRLKWFVYVQ